MELLAKPSDFLTDLFRHAVAAADPMRVVPAALPDRPRGRLLVIGAGKASARMAEAAEAHYGPCEGLVITRYGYARQTQGIRIALANHPVPDAAGVAATREMLEMVRGLGPDDLVVALISGGGSALLCAPADGLDLEEKMRVNADLLACGAPIGQINLVRKHLSRVKGGQLAAACHPARVVSLLISDVPGDDPGLIASGPTVGDDSTPQEALEVLRTWHVSPSDAVARVLARPSALVRTDDPRLARNELRIVAAPSMSLRAAAERATAQGVKVTMLGDALEGEARDLARQQAEMALRTRSRLRPGDAPVLLLSGGECTVTRRGAGIGGPNAEFALAAAIALDGAEGIHVMACDTDGVDGAAEVAGAHAGPETLRRARALGLDPAAALRDNDAHGFFGRLGDQVVTGPTLTNVNDFRTFLILPPSD